ncbi:Hypothetical_protein [Hexamita inflata]|uniref:Hypothetical_protein n=1 Tax=Hexamita inflata TaxID=28002 RepID=A0ABP1HRE3_9EUKA
MDLKLNNADNPVSRQYINQPRWREDGLNTCESQIHIWISAHGCRSKTSRLKILLCNTISSRQLGAVWSSMFAYTFNLSIFDSRLKVQAFYSVCVEAHVMSQDSSQLRVWKQGFRMLSDDQVSRFILI